MSLFFPLLLGCSTEILLYGFVFVLFLFFFVGGGAGVFFVFLGVCFFSIFLFGTLLIIGMDSFNLTQGYRLKSMGIC